MAFYEIKFWNLLLVKHESVSDNPTENEFFMILLYFNLENSRKTISFHMFHLNQQIKLEKRVTG